jgi:hypothetical protein
MLALSTLARDWPAPAPKYHVPVGSAAGAAYAASGIALISANRKMFFAYRM